MTRSDFLLEKVAILDDPDTSNEAALLLNRMHGAIESVYSIAFAMEKSGMAELGQHIIDSIEKASE